MDFKRLTQGCFITLVNKITDCVDLILRRFLLFEQQYSDCDAHCRPCAGRLFGYAAEYDLRVQTWINSVRLTQTSQVKQLANPLGDALRRRRTLPLAPGRLRNIRPRRSLDEIFLLWALLIPF